MARMGWNWNARNGLESLNFCISSSIGEREGGRFLSQGDPLSSFSQFILVTDSSESNHSEGDVGGCMEG